MSTREELEKAVEDAASSFYAADDNREDASDAYDAAHAALVAYDKENK
jgi:hypothetical protein